MTLLYWPEAIRRIDRNPKLKNNSATNQPVNSIYLHSHSYSHYFLIIIMWYEILPSLGIICGAMWLSGKGLSAVQRYQNGGKVLLAEFIITKTDKVYIYDIAS